jgi:polar amino acid transport system permease protein
MFQTFDLAHVIFLVEALRFTLLLFAVGLAGSTVAGAMLAMLATVPSRLLNGLARGAIYAVQGIPLIVLLFIAYFGLSSAGLDVPPLAGAALALTLFGGVFLGEIWRGAIAAVPEGQWQSAAALGLRWGQALRLVIAPQAFRAAIPPTVGFLVQLVKNTSLASLIGYVEVTRAGQLVSNVTFQPLPVFLTVAALYFAVCFPLSRASRALEARMARAGIHIPAVKPLT